MIACDRRFAETLERLKGTCSFLEAPSLSIAIFPAQGGLLRELPSTSFSGSFARCELSEVFSQTLW